MTGMDPRETNVLSFSDPAAMLNPLAPGLRGLWYVDPDGCMRVTVVLSDTPGNGDCARWLDTLRTDRAVIFQAVISIRLAEMLHRRGFREYIVSMPGYNGEAYVRGTCTL